MIWRRAEEHMQWERDAVPAREAPMNPSRQGTKHIGGYFSPEVSRQLRMIAAAEDTSNQKLPEALDMLFQSRKMPMIATK